MYFAAISDANTNNENMPTSLFKEHLIKNLRVNISFFVVVVFDIFACCIQWVNSNCNWYNTVLFVIL